MVCEHWAEQVDQIGIDRETLFGVWVNPPAWWADDDGDDVNSIIRLYDVNGDRIGPAFVRHGRWTQDECERELRGLFPNAQIVIGPRPPQSM